MKINSVLRSGNDISTNTLVKTSYGFTNGLMSKTRAGTSDPQLINDSDNIIRNLNSGVEGSTQEFSGQAVDAIHDLIMNVKPH